MSTPDTTLRRLRTLGLSFPETSEVQSGGHPNFRAGKKTFVTFERIKERPSIAFRLNTTDVDLLLGRRQFFLAPYGRGQWVSAWADVPVSWDLVKRLAERSYRLVALKRMTAALTNQSASPRTRRASRASPRAAVRPAQ
jgi:predicted DNA-binding protein (MmcQ/YjbR family)